MLLTVLKHFHSDRLDRSIYCSLQMINADQLKRANRSCLSAESLTNPSQMLQSGLDESSEKKHRGFSWMARTFFKQPKQSVCV